MGWSRFDVSKDGNGDPIYFSVESVIHNHFQNASLSTSEAFGADATEHSSIDPTLYVNPENFDYHPKAMRGWLREAGFKINRQLTVSHFRIATLKRLLPTSLLVAMDALIQPSGNLWQLTPSVFTRSRAVGDTQKAVDGTFFKCPECGDAISEDGGGVLESGCGLRWRVEDGIYNFKEPVG